MKHLISVAAVLTASALTLGCLQEQVVDESDANLTSNGDGGGGNTSVGNTGGANAGGSNTGGANTGGSSAGGSNAGGGQPATMAVAMSRAQLDQLWDEYWANQPSGNSTVTTTSGGGGNLDPDDMFIRISDLGAVCTSPTTELSCGGHWQLSVALPPAYQTPGIYDLDDPAINQYSHMSETGPQNSGDPEDCGWGGGSLVGGTIEVVAINADEIEIVIDMDASIWDADPSGAYVVPRCQ